MEGFFGEWIEGRGGLIADEDGGVAVEGAGCGDALPLGSSTTRQLRAAIAHAPS